MTFITLQVLFGSPTTDKASLATSLTLIGLLTPVSPGDSASSPEVTRCSSVPCRPQTPWCGGRMRTPSSKKCRLDLAPPLADRFILGVSPSITARYLSAGPSDSTSRWTPCPPKYSKRWLQVGLGCAQLSPSCPFRPLHTFRFSGQRGYEPRFLDMAPLI